MDFLNPEISPSLIFLLMVLGESLRSFEVSLIVWISTMTDAPVMAGTKVGSPFANLDLRAYPLLIIIY